MKALAGLEEEPPKGDIVRLKNGETEYRLRKGGYRILFDIDRKHSVIIVANIAPRGGV